MTDFFVTGRNWEHTLAVVLFLARASDVGSIYLVTPSLRLVANPIARKLGWGAVRDFRGPSTWGAVFAAGMILHACAMGMFGCAFIRRLYREGRDAAGVTAAPSS